MYSDKKVYSTVETYHLFDLTEQRHLSHHMSTSTTKNKHYTCDVLRLSLAIILDMYAGIE